MFVINQPKKETELWTNQVIVDIEWGFLNNRLKSEIWADDEELTVPPGFGALDVSCWLVDLLRLWFFFLPPAALTERSSTPLALKKATRKGCLDWGPFLPTRPADFMLRLRPVKSIQVNEEKGTKAGCFIRFTTAFKCNFDTVSCSSVDLRSYLGGEKQKSTEIIHQIWSVFGVTLWPSPSSKSLTLIWRIMRRANLPSTVSTQSCRPRFSCGFITQWLLVAVISNTSQPLFDAWIFLEPRRKVSASLKVQRIKATQKQWQIIHDRDLSKNNKNKKSNKSREWTHRHVTAAWQIFQNLQARLC